ncbi:hypothetical protein, partial [Acinetobacter baumannii]
QVGHLISRVIRISLFYQNSTCFVSAYFLKHHQKKKINVWEKCPVAEGTRTCNTAIRYWFAPKDIKKIEDFHLSPVELSGKSRH